MTVSSQPPAGSSGSVPPGSVPPGNVPPGPAHLAYGGSVPDGTRQLGVVPGGPASGGSPTVGPSEGASPGVGPGPGQAAPAPGGPASGGMVPGGGAPSSGPTVVRQGPVQSPAGASFDVFFDTSPGKARDHNEDAVWAAAPSHAASATRGYLFMVADGMGGHNAGEVASQAAVREVYERFYGDTEQDLHRSLDTVIRRTNHDLYNQAQANPAQHGMGTTMTAAVLRGSKLHIGHVGDSRLYLIRNGQIEQVTHDHSWVEEQVRAGVLTRLQAESHPQRNVITRALATGPDVRVDYEEREVQPGDVIVMCSDGLSTEVGDAQIASHATKATSSQEAVQRLIQLANDNGGEDNISVVVVRIATSSGTAPTIVIAPRSVPAKKRKASVLAVVGVMAALALAAVIGAFVLPKMLVPRTAQPSVAETRVAGEAVAVATATLGSALGQTQATPTPAGVGGLATTDSPAPATEMSGPTATLGLEPTSTATPRPSKTQTKTPTKEPLGNPTPATPSAALRPGARASMPVLLEPNNSNETDQVTFKWDANGYRLRETEGYALLVWNADDPQFVGKRGLQLPTVYNACEKPWKETQRVARLIDLAGFGPGRYKWSVVVVDTAGPFVNAQCAVTSDQPLEKSFTLSRGGGAGGTNCTGDNCVK